MQLIQGQALDQVLDELKKLRQSREATTTDAPVVPSSPSRPAAEVARSLVSGGFGSAAVVDSGGEPAGSPASSSVVHLPGSSGHSSLSESRRAYWHSVARIGIQVAEALAYAHGQGTLHRDIKPSNLLLDTHGIVWVTDFGLAKGADGDDLTQTGDLVGTLRYMAPERFAGQSDGRSDLYALGLTLYELLTLRPAFAASDRSKLIAQVQHEEPPRPRRVDPSVPRDLETIVLKAMAREAAHRYPTAEDLAADLRRFVEDKPIRARRVSGMERLWRWCRRNPVMASLTAAVLVLLLAVAVVSTVMAIHIAEARDDATEKARAARQAGEQAEKNAAQTKKALEQADGRLARLYSDRGMELMGRGDLLGSLPWLVEALKIEQNDPVRAESHRIRLRAILQQCPRATLLWHNGPIFRAVFSPDGQRVVTSGYRLVRTEKGANPARDTEARIWDVRSGQSIRLPIPDGLHLYYTAFSPDGSRLVIGGYRDRSNGSQEGEARIWDAATAQPLSPLFRTSDWPACLYASTFSSDGRRIVTIRDRDSELPARRAALAASTVGLLAVPPGQGPLFAATALLPARAVAERALLKSEVQVWDLATGRPAGPPLHSPENGGVNEVDLSPDGSRIHIIGLHYDAEGRQEAHERLWDVSTGLPVGPLHNMRSGYPSTSFSSDHRRVAFCSTLEGAVWIQDATTGQDIWDLHPGEQSPRKGSDLQGALHIAYDSPPFIHLAFLSPDGRRLVTGLTSQPQSMQLWDSATGKRIGERIPHENGFWPTFSPNGRRLLTETWRQDSRTGEIHVWDAATGLPISPPIPQDGPPLLNPSFSPDGRRIVATTQQPGAAGEVRVWDVATGRAITPRLPCRSGVSIPWSMLDFSPDGRHTLVADGENRALLWDLASAPLQHFSGKPGIEVRHPALSSDGRRAVLGDPSGAQMWNTTTGQPIAPHFQLASREGISQAHKVCFSPDGRLVLMIGPYRPDPSQEWGEGAAQVFEAATGRPITPLLEKAATVRGEFSSDSRRVVLWTQYEGLAQVWEVRSGRRVVLPLAAGQQLLHAALAPDGRYLATASRGTSPVSSLVQIWDVATGKQSGPSLAEGTGSVGWVFFSPDGRHLALISSSPDNTYQLRIWDRISAQPLTRLLDIPHPLNSFGGSEAPLAFSSDGQWIVTHGETTARVWDAASLEPVTPPLEHDDVVHHAVFTMDRRRLLTATAQTVRVWDAATGEPISPPLRPGGIVQAATFTTDGRQVLIVTDSHQAQFWDLSPDSRSIEDLELLAGLLSGRKIDRSGALSLSTPQQSSWNKLKATYPDTFTVSPEEAAAWQRSEERERKQAQAQESSELNSRGEGYAQKDRLSEAADAFALAAELAPDDALRGTSLALVRLAMKDEAGYRQVRAELRQRFGKTEDPKAAHFFLWNYCLGPAPPSELTPLLELGRRAAARDPTNPYHWSALGLLLYRAGRFEEALQQLNAALLKSPNKQGRAQDWFFLAMCHHRLGHPQEARKWYTRAVKDLAQIRPSEWRARLELEILQREADAQLKGK
jgi:WD40 repeat protein/tetratricopeptide (TPR) repeat protein